MSWQRRRRPLVCRGRSHTNNRTLLHRRPRSHSPDSRACLPGSISRESINLRDRYPVHRGAPRTGAPHVHRQIRAGVLVFDRLLGLVAQSPIRTTRAGRGPISPRPTGVRDASQMQGRRLGAQPTFDMTMVESSGETQPGTAVEPPDGPWPVIDGDRRAVRRTAPRDGTRVDAEGAGERLATRGCP